MSILLLLGPCHLLFGVRRYPHVKLRGRETSTAKTEARVPCARYRYSQPILMTDGRLLDDRNAMYEPVALPSSEHVILAQIQSTAQSGLLASRDVEVLFREL
jgi:hypothetical protein